MDYKTLATALNDLEKGQGNWAITPIADLDNGIEGIFMDLEHKEPGVRYYLAEYIEPVPWDRYEPTVGPELWRCIIDDKIIQAGISKAAKVLIEERTRI